MAQRELTITRRLLWAGISALSVLWPLEAFTGVIATWDRWLYPLMLVVFTGLALWLRRSPDKPQVVYLIGGAMLNTYLVAAALMAIFTGDPQSSIFPLVTTTHWMPLGYAAAFVVMARRASLILAGLTMAALFVPVGVAIAMGHLTVWGPQLPVLTANLALAHGVFILGLISIASLRNGYIRSQERIAVMETLASTDMLTGMPNRRALTQQLQSHVALANRHAQTLSVLMLDVDHFKVINDQYGHAGGDDVLRELSAVLGAQLRASDHAGRWGGEEFLVVAPGVGLPGAMDLAERIRAAVEQTRFSHGQQVTVSVGVTDFRPGDTMDTLLRRADAALYGAKRQGRNQVTLQALP